MAMILAKAGAAGLTSAILLKKQRGYSNCTAVTFSVMYALCGFFIVQTMNPMWLDGLLGLPLVIMGIERLCEKKSFALYVLSLLYVFVTNFYIGYMIGIFSALYFVYFTLSNRSEKTRGASVIVVYGFSSLAAILMSCFMIMPVYMSLSNGKFSFSGVPDYTPVENFNIADIFIKLFPTTYDTVRMEGLPILYCGTLALVMAKVLRARAHFRRDTYWGSCAVYVYPTDRYAVARRTNAELAAIQVQLFCDIPAVGIRSTGVRRYKKDSPESDRHGVFDTAGNAVVFRL